MGSSNAAASEASRISSQLGQEEFALGKTALGAGMDYASAEYGGKNIDLGPAYQARATDVLEGSMSGAIDSSSLQGMVMSVGTKAQTGAVGGTGVANQRIMAGLDEVNKVRSTLAGNGLKTTGLGVTAAGVSNQALANIPQYNKNLQTAIGVAGAGAAAYGAYADSQSMQAQGRQAQFATQGPVGSDTNYLNYTPQDFSNNFSLGNALRG